MEKTQTSIEWLENEIKKSIIPAQKDYFKWAFDQAKSMEKQEIIDAHLDGQSLVSCKDEYAEQYYQETFGSGMSEKPTDHKDKIVQQVIDKFNQRSEVGIKKYGTTLEQNNNDDFLNHLQEELMDAIL